MIQATPHGRELRRCCIGPAPVAVASRSMRQCTVLLQYSSSCIKVHAREELVLFIKFCLELGLWQVTNTVPHKHLLRTGILFTVINCDRSQRGVTLIALTSLRYRKLSVCSLAESWQPVCSPPSPLQQGCTSECLESMLPHGRQPPVLGFLTMDNILQAASQPNRRCMLQSAFLPTQEADRVAKAVHSEHHRRVTQARGPCWKPLGKP